MTVAFVQMLNEYVIDSLFEADAAEITASIGGNDFPTQEAIDSSRKHMLDAIAESRILLLKRMRNEYEHANELKAVRNSDAITAVRSVPNMLSDIVAALSNSDKTPEGIVLAFRNQGANGDDNDIQKIWQDLVDLGLIRPDELDE